MPWVRFIKNYDHRHASGARTEYLTGMVVNVPQGVHEAAEAAGVIEKATAPRNGKTVPGRARERTYKRHGGVHLREVVSGGHGIKLDNSGNPETVSGTDNAEKVAGGTTTTGSKEGADGGSGGAATDKK